MPPRLQSLRVRERQHLAMHGDRALPLLQVPMLLLHVSLLLLLLLYMQMPLLLSLSVRQLRVHLRPLEGALLPWRKHLVVHRAPLQLHCPLLLWRLRPTLLLRHVQRHRQHAVMHGPLLLLRQQRLQLQNARRLRRRLRVWRPGRLPRLCAPVLLRQRHVRLGQLLTLGLPGCILLGRGACAQLQHPLLLLLLPLRGVY